MIEEHIRKKIVSSIRDIPQADSFVSNRLSLLIEELEKWNKKYNISWIKLCLSKKLPSAYKREIFIRR